MRYDTNLKTQPLVLPSKAPTWSGTRDNEKDPRREVQLKAHAHRIRLAEAKLRAMGLDPTQVPAGIADTLLEIKS